MRYFSVFLFAALAACGGSSNWGDIYATGGDGDSGGSGGGGGEANACEYVPPLLGYDPGNTPTGALVPLDIDVGGITASVLAPFPVGTTCQEVIVGMQLPISTTAPPNMAIVMFDSLSAETPTGKSAIDVVKLDDAVALPTKDPYTLEYHFKVKSYHAAYLSPFVGTVVDPQFQIATMPECDPARTMRYRPKDLKGWSLLSAEIEGLPLAAVHASLYYGLAECSPD